MLHIDDAMKNYKKDKVLLLTALQSLVKENLEFSSITPYNDEEVSEVVIELTDKKRVRNLEKISDALDLLIKEVKNEKKLHEQEKQYNEEKRINNARAFAELVDAHQ
jgi:methyl coenzyme M reductase beta subunit